VHLTAADGQSLDWIVYVMKDDGAWKVCKPRLEALPPSTPTLILP
jgi:hypothetical protein